MRLQALRLLNFRNIPQADVPCAHPRIFLLGSNGQGKTNFLEAVGLFNTLRSFRTHDRRALLGPLPSPTALGGDWMHERQGEVQATITFEKTLRRVELDGVSLTKASEFIGLLPTVAMASQDIQLIRGAPALRRQFIDMVLLSSSPDYVRALQRYQKSLLERNALLKADGPNSQIAAFDEVWIPAGWEIYQHRTATITSLSQCVRETYTRLSGDAEPVDLLYLPKTEAGTLEEWTSLIKKSLERDRAARTSLNGPHRDDLAITLRKQSAQTHASEGQQRSLVLALRLAQLQWIHQRSAILPVLLADDILNELDPARRNAFWSVVQNITDLQILATGTTPPTTDPQDWQTFMVKDGHFQPSQ